MSSEPWGSACSPHADGAKLSSCIVDSSRSCIGSHGVLMPCLRNSGRLCCRYFMRSKITQIRKVCLPASQSCTLPAAAAGAHSGDGRAAAQRGLDAAAAAPRRGRADVQHRPQRLRHHQRRGYRHGARHQVGQTVSILACHAPAAFWVWPS